MTAHPQVPLGMFEVDELMAPLLSALWQQGIQTVSSCQDQDGAAGWAWIGFASTEDAEQAGASLLDDRIRHVQLLLINDME